VNSSKYILLMEYDGTHYHGFQWQADLPTIQNELEQAMKKFCGGSSRVTAASRTDAGVHAKGQVVSFWAKPSLSLTTLVKALNYYLPQDIAVKAAGIADGDFNVRRDALSREYHYYILNRNTRSPFGQRFALFVPGMLNIEAMNEACQLIQGKHDFMSFTSSLALNPLKQVQGQGKSTVRYVYEAKVERRGNFTIFRMVANSFLPHQVRRTVGLLLRSGLGKISTRNFQDIVEAKNLALNQVQGNPVAPPCGLYLMKVNYPEQSEGSRLWGTIASEARQSLA